MQCLTNDLLAGSPFPSHPTGRSVFPSPAVRQSSSHPMRRLSVVLDDPAPDVDQPPGIQSRIRVSLPPEASSFTAIVQVSAKANVDESLQVPKRVACIGVSIVIDPSPHRLIHLFHKLRPDEVKPFGQLRNPSFVAIDGQIHSLCDRLERLKSLGSAPSTYENRIIGIPMQRGSQFLRITPLVPHLVQQVQVDVAVERRNR